MKYLRLNSKKGLLYSDNTERSSIIIGGTLANIRKFIDKEIFTGQDLQTLSKEELIIMQYLLDNGIAVYNEDDSITFKNYVVADENIDVQEIPTVLYLLITNLCNFKCKHCCWEDHYKKEEELNLEQLKSLVDDMVSLGIFRLSISGGEPTTRYNELIELIKYAQSKGITSICIATNGHLLNEEKLQELVDAGLTEVQFSIDHFDKEIHNAGRKEGNLEKIEELTKLINQKFCNKLNISAGLTLTNKNKSDILSIIDYTISIGIKKMKVVRFSGITELSKEEKYEITDKEEIKKICCDLVLKAKECLKNGVVVKLSSMISANAEICGVKHGFKRGRNCEALRQRICVKSDGNVSPCPMLSSHDIYVGNVKQSSLLEVFLSKEAKAFKTIYKDNEKCQNCKHYSVCGGGCLQSSITKNKTMTGVDDWCIVE